MYMNYDMCTLMYSKLPKCTINKINKLMYLMYQCIWNCLSVQFKKMIKNEFILIVYLVIYAYINVYLAIYMYIECTLRNICVHQCVLNKNYIHYFYNVYLAFPIKDQKLKIEN